MIASIDPFHAIAISREAHRLEAEGRSILHMEFGQPSTGAPAASIAVAHHVLNTDPMGYWESQPLKGRIARHYRDAYGLTIDPERILLTCGASPGLVLALTSLFAPGARVATARPGYVAYRNTLKALYLEPLEIACGPAERYQISADALSALDPAPDGLILASPANPTGTIIPAQELARIAATCAARGIAIISDEIYHGLSFGDPARSMLEFAPDAIIVNSFSKYYSMAGWRLGWIVVPPSLIDAARARMGNLFLTPPVLAQQAGLQAFEETTELDGHVATYRRNRQLLLDALPALGLASIAPPDGAFYLYADISRFTNDAAAFCQRMLAETGIAATPGFDFDRGRGHYFMRFSFAGATDRMVEAAQRLKAWGK